MELKRATPALLRSPIIRQIIKDEIIEDLLKRLQEGIIMNIIVINNVPVGFVALTGADANNLMAVIHQDHRKNGYVFAACQTTIQQGFTELSLPVIRASVIKGQASHHLALKLGLKEVDAVSHPQFEEVFLEIYPSQMAL